MKNMHRSASICLEVLGGKTYAEIAEVHGVSAERIRALTKNALRAASVRYKSDEWHAYDGIGKLRELSCVKREVAMLLAEHPENSDRSERRIHQQN